jgi:hypothetical protein
MFFYICLRAVKPLHIWTHAKFYKYNLFIVSKVILYFVTKLRSSLVFEITLDELLGRKKIKLIHLVSVYVCCGQVNLIWINYKL